LQELVYKNGQAGVNKASVTITFDNADKDQSPQGYEHYDELSITRQVVIGGKNKYLINGSNIQNNRVQDLFRSVQLNVNNPHFLIMQGRITKVLNMKPHEILAMIEEAAGTMMYEAKKQAAQKTIEKKDHKLNEINNVSVLKRHSLNDFAFLHSSLAFGRGGFCVVEEQQDAIASLGLVRVDHARFCSLAQASLIHFPHFPLQILNEEISPTLRKLREERSTYLEFQKVQRELEHLQRLYLAWVFVTAEEASVKTQDELGKVNEEMEAEAEKVEEGEKEIGRIHTRVEELHRLREGELGGKLDELERVLSEREKTAVTLESSIKATRDSAKGEEKKMMQIRKGLDSDHKHFKEKQKVADGLQDTYDRLRQEHEKRNEAVKQAQARYEAISVGKFSNEDGQAETLQGQVSA